MPPGSIPFLLVVVPIVILLVAGCWWLTFLLERWLLSFFIDRTSTRYLCIGLFHFVTSLLTKPLIFLLIGLPVLGLMWWRDPER